jgi:DNA replication protein DnaC
MSYDIIDDSLSTEDADRLYRQFPELRSGICPTCEDKTVYRWRGVTHECDCPRQLQLAKHYGAAGIGRTFQWLDWTDFVGDTEEICHYLTNYESYLRRGVGLLLSGPVGTGKTMLANLVLKELVKRGIRCYATTFANTIEAFTSTWGDRDQKQWFADKFMYSPVLLLDDLGKEMRTGNRLPQSTFDNILRTRVHDARPTILTTNLTVDDLSFGYGASALSLLKGASILIEMHGGDFRRQSSERTMEEIDHGEVRPIV